MYTSLVQICRHAADQTGADNSVLSVPALALERGMCLPVYTSLVQICSLAADPTGADNSVMSVPALAL